MWTCARLVIFAIAPLLLIAACGGKTQTSSPGSDAQPDIYQYLRKPGKLTHIRYTTYTPPWPTRTEAWIDWDNDRNRSWDIQWTDNPTNPSVCTSIRNGEDWYPCLPSLEKFAPKDSALLEAFSPKIPLRASASELSILLPNRDNSATESPDQKPAPVRLEKEITTTRKGQGSEGEVVVRSWKVATDLGTPCQEGQTGSADFEYTSTGDGAPVSEFIVVTCGQQHFNYLGVLYHDVQFVDRADLPPDFFDVASARTSLIADEMSSAAAQVGSAFWLGEDAGEWKLAGAEHDASSATVSYSRGDGGDAETVELTTRVAVGIGRQCANAELIATDAYAGSLCAPRDASDKYRVVWTPSGFDVWLEKRSYPYQIGRDDILALAARIQRWDKKAAGPLMKPNDVSNLVADSLELVCPGKRPQIREARSTSSFNFDRKTGEWTGVFGSFGEYAVPDAKPVAIPSSQREAVESTLSHNAAEFAGCVVDEQPPPQEGDDEFGVKYVSTDSSGFAFEVTGVDSKAEAALSLCLLTAQGCGLTDPEGVRIASGALDLNQIRSNVYQIHLGLKADESSRIGTWTFALDLGDGRSAQTTFEVR